MAATCMFADPFKRIVPRTWIDYDSAIKTENTDKKIRRLPFRVTSILLGVCTEVEKVLDFVSEPSLVRQPVAGVWSSSLRTEKSKRKLTFENVDKYIPNSYFETAKYGR